MVSVPHTVAPEVESSLPRLDSAMLKGHLKNSVTLQVLGFVGTSVRIKVSPCTLWM